MILRPELHALLVDWITNRPIFYPTRFTGTFPDGFRPTHLKCYATTKKVYEHFGYPIIAGIALLDKDDKLYPWPHMVNATGSHLKAGLVDASPVPDQPNLGFVPIRVNETLAWNEITTAYLSASRAAQFGPRWGCNWADDLTDRFFDILRSRAASASWSASAVAVPPTIPEIA
ncbi:MAG TPA: hypothetical protein VF688_03380 [Allosphingosinicella sp.]|jgi:hypothetical protein